jgi:hypothetical protein
MLIRKMQEEGAPIKQMGMGLDKIQDCPSTFNLNKLKE